MPNYRRAIFKGGCYYFFTVVINDRKEILTTPIGYDCFQYAWGRLLRERPVDPIALCLLPNHLHTIWKMPDGDADFSIRWAMFKGLFTKAYRKRGGLEGKTTFSRVRKREAAVWQRRFWEHQIRDRLDLKKHFDYIHFNPVKHGHVKCVSDWPYSTYHKYLKSGWYQGTQGLEYVRNIQEENFGGE